MQFNIIYNIFLYIISRRYDGIYLQQNTFVSKEKYIERDNFVIDYNTRKIKVEFSTEFKDIDGEIYIEQHSSYRSITTANKFLASFGHKHNFILVVAASSLANSTRNGYWLHSSL
ncbi:hypothetical protein GLOIN_2v1661116 [Rhizophagus clarus]|uniref:Uncharacterized protein n=1 Tax=Rhizophagus clarus TaxID=94130 RepID=A0A8H3M3D8_9GLOM|nr:hypothetical protein GLOIN_2v1661116 [Rhizophagus clarus]